MLAVMVAIVFVERAQRRIPVHYAKRQQGRKMYGGQTTHLPLRLNTAGVIPPIFAGSLLVFPATIAQFSEYPWLRELSQWFNPTSLFYNLSYAALIVFFCYFYTAIIFDPKDIAENLKKQGGFVPGIRPGEKTREYIDTVLTRITLWGALYITLICLLPQFLNVYFKIPFYFGGTSVLIVVGVAMDFMGQVNSYMISRQYEGLMGKAKLKGRYQ
jgi:preprotein translocase subunit SecY